MTRGLAAHGAGAGVLRTTFYLHTGGSNLQDAMYNAMYNATYNAMSVRANLTVIHVSPTRPEGPPRQTGWGQAPQHHPLHDIPPSEGNFGRGVPQCSTENICPSRGTPEKYGQGPHTKRKPAAGQHKRFAPEIPQSKGDTGWPHGRPCAPPERRH